jgi:hypothetical protein
MSMKKIRFLDSKGVKEVRERINRDPEFHIAARCMSQDILIAADDQQCIFKVRDGVITEIVLNPSPMEPWNFFIKAPEKSWRLFLQPIPPPFFHSLFGAALREDFQFGGDVEAMFAHYWATQRMLTMLRQLQNE